jgi:N-glycosylase/DNA lyase
LAKKVLINIDSSINSGQYFLWEKIGTSWYGIYGENILKITKSKSHSGEIVYEYDSFPEYKNWQNHVFRLSDDYDNIMQQISRDAIIEKIITKYKGLRILRQQPIQCLFSFLCSSNNNIPRIRFILKNMSKKFGKKVFIDDREFYTFPTLEALCNASISDLLDCGLGYRARFISNAAKDIYNKKIELELKATKYNIAKEELLKLDGIGEKIADCILLFSLDKLEAFPIDIWIIKFLYNNLNQITNSDIKISSKLTPSQYRKISEEIRKHYGCFSGYAQQYLYYNIREENRRKW